MESLKNDHGISSDCSVLLENKELNNCVCNGKIDEFYQPLLQKEAKLFKFSSANHNINLCKQHTRGKSSSLADLMTSQNHDLCPSELANHRNTSFSRFVSCSLH